MAKESCHFTINEALTLFANQGIEIGTKAFELKRDRENISPECPPEYQEAMKNMFKKALTCQYVKSSPTDPRGEFVTFKDSNIGKRFFETFDKNQLNVSCKSVQVEAGYPDPYAFTFSGPYNGEITDYEIEGYKLTPTNGYGKWPSIIFNTNHPLTNERVSSVAFHELFHSLGYTHENDSLEKAYTCQMCCTAGLEGFSERRDLACKLCFDNKEKVDDEYRANLNFLKDLMSEEMLNLGFHYGDVLKRKDQLKNELKVNVSKGEGVYSVARKVVPEGGNVAAYAMYLKHCALSGKEHFGTNQEYILPPYEGFETYVQSKEPSQSYDLFFQSACNKL